MTEALAVRSDALRTLPASPPRREDSNPLIRKLSQFAQLTQSDHDVLDALAGPEECFPAHVDIAGEGDVPRSVFMMKEGMAIRYRMLPDGGRQIMTFLLPGDLCDSHAFLLRSMDHSIGTLTPVRISPISRDGMMETYARRPRISAALWWSSMQEEAMLRERIVSLGRRDARARIAYLFCELLWRNAAIGLAEGGRFQFPLTQTQLGDTLGITPVHVNRILKEYRLRGLISMERRVVHLLDVQGLQGIACFDQSYLQLRGATADVVRYCDELERREPSAARASIGHASPGAPVARSARQTS
ncbi:Crp/Fnr family transcriptional regulator [Polymorphobacter sp. PAMC 29334]|uniref:Crp/Fnr family transcriptional regulator n=1 Tax=Polymorphobacter sp. PAMC 29334 TaxID=2862331 RepID=UPI001C66D5FD|nr:Crp/Fnr family transcriptional regulator [Polymorphobacter sp. PAMC 29334]QYE35612.1 Crp/Fnr family transcriptional regulator [Polymorphobacter sp. PAMC 29334]